MVLDLLLEHASPKSTAITLVVALVLYAVFTRIIEERKIRSLGGHAPRIPNYAPLGTIISPISSSYLSSVNSEMLLTSLVRSRYRLEGRQNLQEPHLARALARLFPQRDLDYRNARHWIAQHHHGRA